MQIMIAYAMSLVGTPYIWGGKKVLTGLDCSGFVQELLKSAGMDPPMDQNAQAYYDHFESMSTHNSMQAGALAFYGKDTRSIIHVAMLIDNYRVVESGGGGSHTLTRADAESSGACVRIRPIKYRGDFLLTLKPSYATIGIP